MIMTSEFGAPVMQPFSLFWDPDLVLCAFFLHQYRN